MVLIKLNDDGHVLLREDLGERFANVATFDVRVENDSIRLTPHREDLSPEGELAFSAATNRAGA